MEVKLYCKAVDGRDALRIEILDKGVGVYVNGRWCDTMDYDPLPVFASMAERFLERPLTDKEAAGIKMPDCPKKKAKKKAAKPKAVALSK